MRNVGESCYLWLTAVFVILCVKIHNVSPDVFKLFYATFMAMRLWEIIDIANKYGATNLELQAETYYASSLSLQISMG
jgi:hypothetical protein